MNLIYDGVLSSDVTYNIKDMLDKYPNVCEISEIPNYDVFKKWQDQECPLYITEHEDCMGIYYTKEQTLYGLVQKNFFDKEDTTSFIFFKTEGELNRFIIRFLFGIVPSNSHINGLGKPKSSMNMVLFGVEKSAPAVMLGPRPGSTSRFAPIVPAKRKSPLPENRIPRAGLRLARVR